MDRPDPVAADERALLRHKPTLLRLRDYGVAGQIGLEPSPDAYVAALVAVFRNVRRVLRRDGTLWLVIGDSWIAAR
jgi:site-specific DNA-methyltransferase (adenine-specific)